MRTNLGWPSASAFNASFAATGCTHPPPIQPHILPSEWMIALSPGLPDVGGWQRTTVATAKDAPLATNSDVFFRKRSSIDPSFILVRRTAAATVQLNQPVLSCGPDAFP